MVIKQKIDSVTNNIFFRISRIGFIKTTSNTVSSMFQTGGLKVAYITLMVLFTTGIVFTSSHHILCTQDLVGIVSYLWVVLFI